MIHWILVVGFIIILALISLMVFVGGGVALGAALGGDDKEAQDAQDALGMVGLLLCILFACYMGYLLPGSAVGRWMFQLE